MCKVRWSSPSKSKASAGATSALSCDTKDKVPELELWLSCLSSQFETYCPDCCFFPTVMGGGS